MQSNQKQETNMQPNQTKQIVKTLIEWTELDSVKWNPQYAGTGVVYYEINFAEHDLIIRLTVYKTTYDKENIISLIIPDYYTSAPIPAELEAHLLSTIAKQTQRSRTKEERAAAARLDSAIKSIFGKTPAILDADRLHYVWCDDTERIYQHFKRDDIEWRVRTSNTVGADLTFCAYIDGKAVAYTSRRCTFQSVFASIYNDLLDRLGGQVDNMYKLNDDEWARWRNQQDQFTTWAQFDEYSIPV
jgi:hypothetical protein